jgi:hypothetical protein
MVTYYTTICRVSTHATRSCHKNMLQVVCNCSRKMSCFEAGSARPTEELVRCYMAHNWNRMVHVTGMYHPDAMVRIHSRCYSCVPGQRPLRCWPLLCCKQTHHAPPVWSSCALLHSTDGHSTTCVPPRLLLRRQTPACGHTAQHAQAQPCTHLTELLPMLGLRLPAPAANS